MKSWPANYYLSFYLRFSFSLLLLTFFYAFSHSTNGYHKTAIMIMEKQHTENYKKKKYRKQTKEWKNVQN